MSIFLLTTSLSASALGLILFVASAATWGGIGVVIGCRYSCTNVIFIKFWSKN